MTDNPQNGGHCQPVVYASPPSIAAFELETYHFLAALVADNHIPCDWVSLPGGGVHAFLTQDLFDLAQTAVSSLRKVAPDLASQVEVVSSSEDLAELRVPGVKGAVVQRHAASLWPYKLVAWVLERLLDGFAAEGGFNLQTDTPVTCVEKEADGGLWTVTTPRGKVRAAKVLLCTNGYTSRLLPRFGDLIVPVRGQVAALLPPRDGRGRVAGLRHSYVFMGEYEAPVGARDDYLVQRPLPDGELVFGGGRNFAKGLGVGEWRDDVVEERVGRWLKGQLSPPLDLRPGPGPGRSCTIEEGEDVGEGMELDASFEWTGIMGYSRDHHPWVGAVPSSLGGGGVDGGLWICAGYTGHGMPVAALAAREVVRLMLGGGEDVLEGSVSLPLEYRLTEERLHLARREFKVVEEAQKDGFEGHFPDLFAGLTGVQA